MNKHTAKLEAISPRSRYDLPNKIAIRFSDAVTSTLGSLGYKKFALPDIDNCGIHTSIFVNHLNLNVHSLQMISQDGIREKFTQVRFESGRRDDVNFLFRHDLVFGIPCFRAMTCRPTKEKHSGSTYLDYPEYVAVVKEFEPFLRDPINTSYINLRSLGKGLDTQADNAAIVKGILKRLRKSGKVYAFSFRKSMGMKKHVDNVFIIGNNAIYFGESSLLNRGVPFALNLLGTPLVVPHILDRDANANLLKGTHWDKLDLTTFASFTKTKRTLKRQAEKLDEKSRVAFGDNLGQVLDLEEFICKAKTASIKTVKK